MVKILLASNDKINNNLNKDLNKNNISTSNVNLNEIKSNENDFIMFFDIDIVKDINLDFKNSILYINKDITTNLNEVVDNYELYNKLNKFNIITSNNVNIINKIIYIFPILKNKIIHISELTNEYLNNKLNEILFKKNKKLRKFKTATCTVIKDEQQYLEEWINHNLNLGFDEIWLYEDFNSIPHNDICDKYPQVHLNKIEDIESKINVRDKQTSTWNYFINEYKDQFDWVAFIDIDEFIMFDEGWDFYKLLNEYQNEGGIYLFWQMFNASGHIDNPHTPLLTTFTEKCTIINQDSDRWHFKSIVNLKIEGQKFITNHECLYGVSTNGLRTRNHVCFEKCWINHYFSRSWEEWCDRFLKRGDITPYCRSYLHFFECNENMIDLEDILLERFEQWKIKYNAKTLTIYYIATDEQKKYFYNFTQTIYHFMPHLIKQVIVLSDGLEEFNGVTIKGVKYIVKHIDHYHWPIINLFKASHILNNKVDTDFVLSLNANTIFNPIFHAYYMFDFNKVNISKHFGYDDGRAHAVEYIKDALVKVENKDSLCYIDNTNYTYLQSDMLFGKSDLIYSMYEDIDNMVKIDLKNNILPYYHEESYINKWAITNKDKVHANYFLRDTNRTLFRPFTIIGETQTIK